jgi:hypothetical protein
MNSCKMKAVALKGSMSWRDLLLNKLFSFSKHCTHWVNCTSQRSILGAQSVHCICAGPPMRKVPFRYHVITFHNCLDLLISMIVLLTAKPTATSKSLLMTYRWKIILLQANCKLQLNNSFKRELSIMWLFRLQNKLFSCFYFESIVIFILWTSVF